MNAPLALGIDIGTSGVRTAVIDSDRTVVSMARADHLSTAASDATAWWDAVQRALHAQARALLENGIDPRSIDRLAVDGTSGSMVLVDRSLNPLTRALYYNTAGFDAEAAFIARFAPNGAITRGSGSALARALHLREQVKADHSWQLLHQADFIVAKLAGGSLGSDDNNALKLGWDPERRSWPDWFEALHLSDAVLPAVERPGTAVGTISAKVASEFGFNPDLTIHAGTTDSIAAFLASGADEIGDGVTSLGTTLAIKLLSERRIDEPDLGIYSHLVRGRWLAGGASNTGGGVLASLFSQQELVELSGKIDPEIERDLGYYPLAKPGERFPVNDPHLAPRLEPRPTSDHEFLHAVFEAMARIEAEGYQKLEALGAPRLVRMFTAGGGANNAVWRQIRSRHLGVSSQTPHHQEAAVGAASLCF
ncbi:MAG: FGGY-family carbohydrate kinase [Pseudomonadota bacterium]